MGYSSSFAGREAVMEDIYNNPDFIRNEYQEPEIPVFISPTVGGGTIVTNLAGATGPVINFGGTTGLSFTGVSATITVAGTLVAANGGTGQSSYTKGDLLAASAATTLTKLAVAANDARLATDSTQTTGLIWIAASTGWGAASGTLSRAAYAAYAGQTVSVAYVQAEAQATDDAVKLLSQTVAALLTDLRTQKIVKT